MDYTEANERDDSARSPKEADIRAFSPEETARMRQEMECFAPATTFEELGMEQKRPRARQPSAGEDAANV